MRTIGDYTGLARDQPGSQYAPNHCTLCTVHTTRSSGTLSSLIYKPINVCRLAKSAEHHGLLLLRHRYMLVKGEQLSRALASNHNSCSSDGHSCQQEPCTPWLSAAHDHQHPHFSSLQLQ